MEPATAPILWTVQFIPVGRDCIVGIATRYRAGRSGDQTPVEATFSAAAQTCPGAHPASCTMRTGSLSRG
jgi:hypothetical protein